MFRFIIKDRDTTENFRILSHFGTLHPLQVHVPHATAMHVQVTVIV